MTEVEGTERVPAMASQLLTFLIADICGYTAYTASRGDEAAADLSERFLDLCRQVVDSYGGNVFGSAGDQALAAFPSARQALRAAIVLQQRLAEQHAQQPEVPWAAGIGLDTGDAVLVGADYRSGAINLAARLCSLAGAAEIFASEGVIHTAHTTDGVAFVDRGEVTLKGLTAPVRVIQIGSEGGLSTSLPPLQPILVTHPTNLPDEPTPFIGRQREIQDISRLVQQPQVRLLTLTGPGGTGKTRLALQIGTALLHDFRDGVFFVDLAPLTDSALVPSAIARVLHVQERGGVDLLETLTDHLSDKHLLLVLDNFEHLLTACSVPAQLLDACRTLHILITSRIPLHVTREQEYPVPPLTVPDPEHLPDLERLSQYEAVALFIDRARAVKPTFAVTNENAPAVAEICARLDGLPLAIELAAARIKLFPPQALLQRLSSRMSLLTGGAKDRPTRQQTLRGTIDLSYSLLSEAEQTLFARLSVFVGGCSYEAAEAVCNTVGDLDLLDGLSSLVDKNLLRQEGDEESRFLMLETIREYAGEKLRERKQDPVIWERHARYYTTLAEEAEPQLMGREQTRWFALLEREHDNLRAALRWSRKQGGETGLRLASALFRFWEVRGHFTEGLGWLEDLLTQTGEQSGDPALRAKARNGAGNLAWLQGEYQRAKELYEEGLRLRRELGDKWGIASSLNNLGNIAERQGDYPRATELHKESLRLRQEVGDKPGTAASLGNLGIMAQHMGEYERATELYEESLRLSKELGNKEGIAVSLGNLGIVAEHTEQYEQATELYEESLRLGRELGDKGGIALAICNLGIVASRQKEYDRAIELLGAADAIWERIKSTPGPDERARMAEATEAAHTALGPDDYDEAWARGRDMTLEQAIAYALGSDIRPAESART